MSINLDELKEEADRAIRGAFPVGVAPSEAAMRNDHCPECRETAARFTGRAWADVGVDDLLGNPGPSCLTAAGFRYYLPAMMLRSLEATRQLDCLPAGVIGELSPAGGKVSGRIAERLSGFTREQMKAILAFLRCCEVWEKVELSGPDWPDEAILAVPAHRVVARAIRYWNDRVSGDAARDGGLSGG